MGTQKVMGSNRLQGVKELWRPDNKMAVTIVYVLGVFILIIDTTIVNVALPTIGRDFGVPANEIQWVVLGYLLTLAIGIPAAPWLASRIGPKKAFAGSLVGFVVASALAGFAPSVNWLIAARVLQGLPAGLITPIGAAMLYRAYPQNERARAAAAVVGVSVLAPSVGPVLGGVIVDNLSWPWIFFVNVPIGLAAIALAAVWLGEEDRDPDTTFDRIGFALAGTGLATFLYAISAGPERGWASAVVLGSLAVGITCLVALVRFELGHSDPLIEFRLLADRHFRTINLVGLSVYAAFISFVYVLPIYLQSFVGVSATQAGTTQVPQAFAVFTVSNFLARRTYNRYGARLVLGVGAFAGLIVSGLFSFRRRRPQLVDSPRWNLGKRLHDGIRVRDDPDCRVRNHVTGRYRSRSIDILDTTSAGQRFGRCSRRDSTDEQPQPRSRTERVPTRIRCQRSVVHSCHHLGSGNSRGRRIQHTHQPQSDIGKRSLNRPEPACGD